MYQLNFGFDMNMNVETNADLVHNLVASSNVFSDSKIALYSDCNK